MQDESFSDVFRSIHPGLLIAFAFMFGVAVSFLIGDYYIGQALMEWEEIKLWCELSRPRIEIQ